MPLHFSRFSCCVPAIVPVWPLLLALSPWPPPQGPMSRRRCPWPLRSVR
ncbi:MAG: hypothetical protein GAK31_03422 [Stenotrophomonas maltophilia]|uniref:Uncharacterized protein n=1 Tax=Stenotrophomonas maltophilia TaxID=40324 RepID=A0A7V8FDL3_STEMA|nr:MAG: hypothetical protein GAK31_03422 [Stenotrophomonas maltophilia]